MKKPKSIKARPGPGRPTKLTPELQVKVIEGIELGMPLEQAALAVGISEPTIHRWISEGETDEQYREFREAVRAARAKRMKDLLDHVWRSMKDLRSGPTLQRGDWKAAWKMLETLEPKDFGLKVRIHVTEELTELLKELERVLPAEWFDKVLEVCAALGSGSMVVGAPSGSQGGGALAGGVADTHPGAVGEGVRAAAPPEAAPRRTGEDPAG